MEQEAMRPAPDAARETAIYEDAIAHYGDTAQVIVAIEELSELQRALTKWLRYHALQLHGDAEKISRGLEVARADAQIMLNQLELIFGDNTEAEIERLERLDALLHPPAGTLPEAGAHGACSTTRSGAHCICGSCRRDREDCCLSRCASCPVLECPDYLPEAEGGGD